MSNELIQVVDCISEESINEVFQLMSPAKWEPTTVFGLDGPVVDTSIRSNSRICLDDSHPSAEIMHEGMNAALLKYYEQLGNISEHFQRFPVPAAYRTKCHREQIQVLKYDHEEYYNWHYDQATDPSCREFGRTISIVLYLKNADEGGRTIFPHRAFKPKAGQALIFPSNWCFPHSAEPIVKGQKVVAVTWYHSHYDFSD